MVADVDDGDELGQERQIHRKRTKDIQSSPKAETGEAT